MILYKTNVKYVLHVLLLFVISTAFAQQDVTPETVNGTYHLFMAERGVSGPTKTKLIQFGENNGVKLLAIAACEKCMPAVYTYQEEESKRLGVSVFFNSAGLYVFGYDKDSFVTVLVTSKLGNKSWVNFAFSNFYSKTKSNVDSITKAKIEAYAIKLSKE
jgi:hypothetical protein